MRASPRTSPSPTPPSARSVRRRVPRGAREAMQPATVRDDARPEPAPGLPARFLHWFEARGWTPHAHQIAMLESRSTCVLLVAPTGGGKTLAGFLPSLVELSEGEAPAPGLHT